MRQLAIPLLAFGSLNAVGFIIDGNTNAAIAAFMGTVAVTLGVLKWIDSRIDAKLAAHAKLELWEHRAIIQEIGNLRELLKFPPLDVAAIMAQSRLDSAK